MEILDREYLFNIVGQDPELLREIVDLFFESSSEIVEGIHAAVRNADHEALYRDAHQLKGSLANVGAQAAAEAARVLELIGRNGVLSGIEDALSTLDREMERLTPELRALAGSV
ncbi:Hpt domain-containing protein [bacterium]|nr:Hpt domain-containing protein [bacterium]